MNSALQVKYHALVSLVGSYGKAAVAFSGGVDSTFLAKVVRDVLDTRAVAITVDSEAYPPDTIRETRALADLIGTRLIEIPVRACDIPEFSANEPERCYHCKKTLFSLMSAKADAEDIHILIDGSNMDDLGDYRPGMRALSELGIKSPLKECGFTKAEIRIVSKELGLPTWNRQSFACLASRFPYGTRITPELLERTWKAEAVLHDMGMSRYRVRNHGDLARIEIDADDTNILLSSEDNRKKVTTRLKELGFTYITLDLQGYRTGSMNEPLPKEG
ncbi:MAG: ATP-dependent sacrificial sulfur transferase LarE [Candidatus Latescibacter sp.]|nr:ATP-dependent sacrificial sulfur transferase LarE [Candidatus Latescibacter sp.]